MGQIKKDKLHRWHNKNGLDYPKLQLLIALPQSNSMPE